MAVAKKSKMNTSELLLSSLPDFFHSSSDENVDKDNFDAPATEYSKCTNIYAEIKTHQSLTYACQLTVRSSPEFEDLEGGAEKYQNAPWTFALEPSI